jgi:hypothetical protein
MRHSAYSNCGARIGFRKLKSLNYASGEGNKVMYETSTPESELARLLAGFPTISELDVALRGRSFADKQGKSQDYRSRTIPNQKHAVGPGRCETGDGKGV